MKLSGSYKIPTDKQTVWEALNNPDILQKCIPGCEEFKKNSDTSFTATATNKIGPFNASFKGDIELQDLNPTNSYTLVGQGDSLVGFAAGEAKVTLSEEGGQTVLTYNVEANVGGKIAQVGSRLIDMTAKKMADIFFGKFSELVSPKEISSSESSIEEKGGLEDQAKPKKQNQKILIFAGATLIVAILAFLFL